MTPPGQRALLERAIALHQGGSLADAERLYREILRADPGQPAALHLLGLIAFQAGKAEQALPLIQAALQREPREDAAWNNCGEVLRALRRPGEAETCFREAIRLSPDRASYWSNLGAALQEQRRLGDAEATLRHAISLAPGYSKGWYNLANILRERDKLAEAEQALDRTLALEPSMAEAWNNLGGVRRRQKRMGDAEACFRHAIGLKPRFPEALNNLAACLKDQGRLAEAERTFSEAIRLSPGFAEAISGLAAVFRERGQVSEAIALYERARALRPDNTRTLTSLLFSHEAIATGSDASRAARARAWGDAHLRPPLAPRPTALGARRLRVGYLSGDYGQHAVAQFIGGLFSSHDRSRVEVVAYSNVGAPDDVTRDLRTRVDHWHSIAQLDDEEAARLIHSHSVDILIDLNGHTRGSRTAVLGYRPAPVQALYLGYFATSGLRSVDYWISDEVLHPEPQDAAFVERLWRLPRCWVAYAPPPGCPATDWAPGPRVRLGSMNHLSKLGPATLDLWARVLKALPETELVLKTRHLGDPPTQEFVRAAFRARGVEPERLIFLGHTPGLPAHLRAYHSIDLCLDPTPYSGGTTTCDALWMGVPVVTLAGSTLASRMSASMLTAVGESSWISGSVEAYVDRVGEMVTGLSAMTPAERCGARRALRDRMAASPLTDARDLASHLENAYDRMIHLAAAS